MLRAAAPDKCVYGSGCLVDIDRALAERGDETAGVVIEPVMQGAAGMIAQPEGYVGGVYKLCKHYGALMIADEVATGFGRTGHMFACDIDGVSPDIMAVGKGLSGGYLPIAATLASGEVFENFLGESHDERTFFHGHSYTANPPGCAAALASLKIFEKDRTLENVQKISRQATLWLTRMMNLEHVAETKQAGLMIGIEIEEDPNTVTPYDPKLMMGRRVAAAARERGLIIRPLGDVVVVMPPLCVNKEEIDEIMRITMESVKEVTEDS
jgi:adenosylmethionine-8-amino-7-oxononanoate aminotransferase